MRIMALDIGEKRIGVAVTDELGITSQPVTTIHRRDLQKDIQDILDKLLEYNVDILVIGLPLRGDGEIGTQAKKVLVLKGQIENALTKAGQTVKIETWDESMTTHEAHEVLAMGHVSQKKRKKVVDKLAAVFILESYRRAHGSE